MNDFTKLSFTNDMKKSKNLKKDDWYKLQVSLKKSINILAYKIKKCEETIILESLALQNRIS